ncbi:MAG: DNA-formamidopyrimidine glycosylase [Candidatus Wolfebacteria bacterium]|nr:DNA-formamidopyrimidine glycosylase [Candidatus Wolfebacteria bacterium]
MPELPEVQTIVDDLNKKIIGRKITAVWFDWPKTIKNPKPKVFEKEIKGLGVEKIKRAGKNILIYLSRGYLLLIHQKMTGHLLVGKWRTQKISKFKYEVVSLEKGLLQEKVNGYIHLIFYFDNGWQMALSDLRKFAKVLLGDKEKIENLPELKKLGPDALDKKLSFKKFKDIIEHIRGKIKQALMNQEIISGIGNIYSDEALFLAKIHPFKPANKLTKKEANNLYLAIRRVLKKALRLRGTSISDFRDTSGKAGAYSNVRLVYRKEGKPCPRCQTLIKRVKMAGRSAHFCPKCQEF